MDKAYVRNVNLRSAIFRDVGFKNARFVGCNLSQATFNECYLRRAQFEKCDLVNSVDGALRRAAGELLRRQPARGRRPYSSVAHT